jgi:hypothetical protein
MRAEEKMSDSLQKALSQGLLKRLPLTFLPFVNQQLNQWTYLFPNERQSIERLLLFVSSLTPKQSAALFHDVVALEDKMGVRNREFSTSEQTIQNSSQLAASPYFQDWRKAVQAVFDASDAHALKTSGATVKPGNRLVLLGIPETLPVDAASVWRRWQGIGRPLKLDPGPVGERASALELLLTGIPDAAGGHSAGLLQAVQNRPSALPSDVWVADAGRNLVDRILRSDSSASISTRAILLSNGRLDECRQNFSHEMNTMHKDLADADAVFDRLRKVDISRWCPPEVATDSAVREFLRSVYLTGNGAVIFGNSFVEWTASEAFRRARPVFLAAQFGVRSKPKPFTGVAVFDNPDQVNPLPAVDDLPGSAIDAQMLALYVWLAAYRYDEYQHSTVCVCIAESVSQAYVVAPPEFTLWHDAEPIPLNRLADVLRTWVA